MDVGTTAAYATALSSLQTQNQLQVGMMKQTADMASQAAATLLGGATAAGGAATSATLAAPTGGRGQIVDIQA